MGKVVANSPIFHINTVGLKKLGCKSPHLGKWDDAFCHIQVTLSFREEKQDALT